MKNRYSSNNLVLNLDPNFLLLVNRLSAVADVGDGADDEECGEAIESEDFAGNEDGGPERVASACEHGGKAEGCGEGGWHSEHSRNEYAKRSADGEKRGDDTANESGRKRENREREFQNPVIPSNPGSGDILNPGGSSYNIRGIPNQVCIPGDSKAHVQQVCSKSCITTLEKNEQQSAYSNAHNCNSLNAVRKLLGEEVLRESKQLCKSAADNSEEHAHQRKLHEELSVERTFVRENACRKSTRIEKRIQVHAELVESKHARNFAGGECCCGGGEQCAKFQVADEQNFQCECCGCHRGLENSGKACGKPGHEHNMRCVFKWQLIAYVVRKCGADLHSSPFTTCASAEELRQPSAHSGHRDRDERKVGFLVESYGENLVHAAFRPASPFLISEYDGCTADGEGGDEVQRVCVADGGEPVADVSKACGECADDCAENNSEQHKCRCCKPLE